MIRRRAAAAGIETKIGNHSFRTTGSTAYLKNGGTLEKAASMAITRKDWLVNEQAPAEYQYVNKYSTPSGLSQIMR